MKTSNKILAAFIIILFTFPFLMLAGFKSSIRKGLFTKEKVNNEIKQFTYKEMNKPYKFVKIIGPDIPGMTNESKIFSCNIIPSDSVRYSYYYLQPNGNDKIILKQEGDTLLVQYPNTNVHVDGNNKGNNYISIQVDLYLPVVNKIIVENANVFVDTINTVTNPEISFDLRNQANLQLGRYGHSQTIFAAGTINGSKVSPYVDSSNFSERSGKFINVEIKSSNSSFTIGNYAWIKDLRLQINGQSRVNIANNSRIDSLSGFISDSSEVSANWKNIKILEALTK